VEVSEVRALRSPGTPGMLTPKPVFGGVVAVDVFAVALPVPYAASRRVAVTDTRARRRPLRRRGESMPGTSA
jgi:hypothetical protein